MLKASKPRKKRMKTSKLWASFTEEELKDWILMAICNYCQSSLTVDLRGPTTHLGRHSKSKWCKHTQCSIALKQKKLVLNDSINKEKWKYDSMKIRYLLKALQPLFVPAWSRTITENDFMHLYASKKSICKKN